MSRPPMNLIFPERSAAGISKNADGQRIIAATRRPDGTFRQEIKIRPGYTPQEDVSLFRSTKQVEMDQHRARKGTVPGLKPNAMVQDALRGATTTSGSKSAKKNAKRKEKRNEVAEGGETKESWDDDDEEESGKKGDEGERPTTTTPVAPPVPATSTSAEESTTTEDLAKRLRNLRKKLKQTQQLKEKQDGGATLGSAEQDKVDAMKALEDEIAKLEL